MPQFSRRSFATALPLGLLGEVFSVETRLAPPPVRRHRKQLSILLP